MSVQYTISVVSGEKNARTDFRWESPLETACVGYRIRWEGIGMIFDDIFSTKRFDNEDASLSERARLGGLMTVEMIGRFWETVEASDSATDVDKKALNILGNEVEAKTSVVVDGRVASQIATKSERHE